MSKRKQPDTSLAAYHSLVPEDISELKKKILGAITQRGAMTSEEIADFLGKDYDVVWKRCSDLKNIDKKLCWTGEKRLTRRNRFANVFCLTENASPKTENELRYSNKEKTAADYASKIIDLTTSKQGNLFV